MSQQETGVAHSQLQKGQAKLLWLSEACCDPTWIPAKLSWCGERSQLKKEVPRSLCLAAKTSLGRSQSLFSRRNCARDTLPSYCTVQYQHWWVAGEGLILSLNQEEIARTCLLHFDTSAEVWVVKLQTAPIPPRPELPSPPLESGKPPCFDPLLRNKLYTFFDHFCNEARL